MTEILDGGARRRDHVGGTGNVAISRPKRRISEIAPFSTIVAERGVRHGQLVTVPVEFENQRHAHGAESGRRHLHIHVRETG